MGFASSAFKTKAIGTFTWEDLDGKTLRIRVVKPNPECLEFTGQVVALDIHAMIVYVLHEWSVEPVHEE